MMWALLTVVAGWFGWVLAGPVGAVLGAAVGFVGYFAVIMLLSMIIEPILFGRAARVWLINEPGRRGCAKAAELDDGEWRLSSVAAWPFGRGIGSELTEAVTADADRSERTVQLTAENRRVGSLYERFGFTYPRPGRREMRRDPIQTEARQATAQSVNAGHYCCAAPRERRRRTAQPPDPACRGTTRVAPRPWPRSPKEQSEHRPEHGRQHQMLPGRGGRRHRPGQREPDVPETDAHLEPAATDRRRAATPRPRRPRPAPAAQGPSMTAWATTKITIDADGQLAHQPRDEAGHRVDARQPHTQPGEPDPRQPDRPRK